MAEILKMNTPESAKNVAQEVVQEAQELQQNKQNIIEAALKELNNINPEIGGFEEIATLLVLPDEHFSIIAPTFLMELEKSLNDTNNQLAMAQAMNVAGVKVEDLSKEYLAICEQINIQFADVFTSPKKDFIKRLLGIVYNAASEAEGVAKRHILIPIEYCHADAKMPAYAHLTDAGMDVYALEDITIGPGETKLIPLGIKVALPLGYELQVRPKSGRCLNTKLRIANTPGTIDAGYRNEIGVIVDNIDQFIRDGEVDEEGRLTNILFGSSYTIGKGEKFAQLVLSEVPKAVFYEVENVAGIGEDRGGGFGSTGLK